MASGNKIEKVAILGCGFMGTTLLESWLKQPEGPQFYLSVRSEKSLTRLKEAIRGFNNQERVLSTAFGERAVVEAAKNAEVVILGCPPGELGNLLGVDDLARHLQGKLIISLLAGVSLAKIRQTLASHGSGSAGDIGRVIPTLAARIGQSVTLVAGDASGTQDSRVEALFNSVGLVQHVPEALMDKATALGAVCHALTIVAVDTMSDASAAEGLPRDIALSLAAKCFSSCGSLLNSGMSPEACKDAMAVPRGITINSILDLERDARSSIAGSVRNAIHYVEKMA